MQNPFRKILRDKGLPYRPILGVASAKTIKGEKMGYLTGIVYLMPDLELCPLSALAGCIGPCLQDSGRGRFESVKKARKAKTAFFKNQREAFMLSLCADVWTLRNKANKAKMIPLVRPNGTSDIPFENIIVHDDKNIFQLFPDVQFYDYTKHPSRNLEGKTMGNYDLTYSFSGITPKPITIKGLSNPHNSRTAVVFHKREEIPATFQGFNVVDGDDTDVRHIDPKGVVVALYAKGNAKSDDSGFVQRLGVHY